MNQLKYTGRTAYAFATATSATAASATAASATAARRIEF